MISLFTLSFSPLMMNSENSKAVRTLRLMGGRGVPGVYGVSGGYSPVSSLEPKRKKIGFGSQSFKIAIGVLMVVFSLINTLKTSDSSRHTFGVLVFFLHTVVGPRYNETLWVGYLNKV